MKRRIAAALALTLVATAMMPATALAHHHGGGHHGSRRQATYTAPAPTYTCSDGCGNGSPCGGCLSVGRMHHHR